MPVGSALSVHGGPGTLVVGVQEMSPERELREEQEETRIS